MKKNSKKPGFLFLILVFISLFLLFLDKRGWLGFFHRLTDPPILAAEEKIYSLNILISQYPNILLFPKQKDREIQELRGRLRQLAIDQNQLSVCLEENEHLKKLLGAPLSPKWKFLDAKVVGITEKMRLNRGKKDGVEEGMMVISENILVGRVVSVGENDSLVQLPHDPNSKIPVVIKRTNSNGIQARGLLIGQFGGRLVLDRVLQSEDIQEGNLVITSGEEDWPADLLIGQIEEVLPKTAEVYQKAVVSPLVDYRNLSIVFLVVR